MTVTQLPEGYSVRTATIDDAELVSDLINDCEIDEAGEPEYSPGELAEEWAHLDLRERVVLVEANAGSLAGCLVLKSRGNVVHNAYIYVHPRHTGLGIGAYLINLSEARAQSWVDSAPKSTRVVIRNGVHAHNQAANNLVQTAGYELVRHFWRMEIALDSQPVEPTFSAVCTLRPCRTGQDECVFYKTVEYTFQDH